jgi:hypothetical protein
MNPTRFAGYRFFPGRDEVKNNINIFYHPADQGIKEAAMRRAKFKQEEENKAIELERDYGLPRELQKEYDTDVPGWEHLSLKGLVGETKRVQNRVNALIEQKAIDPVVGQRLVDATLLHAKNEIAKKKVFLDKEKENFRQSDLNKLEQGYIGDSRYDYSTFHDRDGDVSHVHYYRDMDGIEEPDSVIYGPVQQEKYPYGYTPELDDPNWPQKPKNVQDSVREALQQLEAAAYFQQKHKKEGERDIFFGADDVPF